MVSSSGWAVTMARVGSEPGSVSSIQSRVGGAGSITFGHFAAKFRILPDIFGRTGVMRRYSAVFRRKTECQCDLKLPQCMHLAVKPIQGIRPGAIRPAQAGAEGFDS